MNIGWKHLNIINNDMKFGTIVHIVFENKKQDPKGISELWKYSKKIFCKGIQKGPCQCFPDSWYFLYMSVKNHCKTSKFYVNNK